MLSRQQEEEVPCARRISYVFSVSLSRALFIERGE
jgi:hypothetical protein